MMQSDRRRKKGSIGVKVGNAPEGFYTAAQAADRLGLNRNTFRYYVNQGKIERVVPPMRKEGFYRKKEIDTLANEIALFLHTEVSEEEATEVRVATPQDAQGVTEVLTVRGWQTTTASQRIAWYRVNPYIDVVAITNGKVSGYIHAVPFTPEALADMMAVRKRSWNIEPGDILPYVPDMTYDLYVGIATVESIPGHVQHIGFPLISGFLDFLEKLAEKCITIHRLYAVSAEEPGQRLCQKLGFTRMDIPDDYLYPDWHRYMLDLELSQSRFAQRYREALRSKQNA